MSIDYLLGVKIIKITKVALTANVESVVSVTSPGNYVLVQNLGVGSCYVAFDETVDSNKWTLLDGDIFPNAVKCNTVHLLSSSTPTVQVVEVCYGY